MADSLPATDVIASITAPACYLCGAEGVVLYEELSDRWCGAPGLWNLKRCPDPACGLLWLDPVPSKEEVWKAYRAYFTHRDCVPREARRIGFFDLLLIKVHKPLYKLFLHAIGFRRIEKEWRKRTDGFYLGDAVPGGRLLDIGCGNGDFLARMRRRGWIVEGLEVDPEAVEAARAAHGLTIHLGDLEGLAFPGNSFDAITMNQVIEHVHEPVPLIRECLRILKPGGKLVVATPNISSLGHRTYGRNWSHLDPPRHLHLFTKRTLRECATRAGFLSIETWCAPGYAEGDIRASVENAERSSGKRRHEFGKWVEASFLKVRAYFRYLVRKDEEVGEDIVLIARKEK